MIRTRVADGRASSVKRNKREKELTGKDEGVGKKLKENQTSENVRNALSGMMIFEALGLIFGGCCSNVCTLESMIKDLPDIGKLITFCQFVLVSLEGLIFEGFLTTRFPFVRRPRIPAYRFVVPVVLFFLVSIINNQVWMYDISIPAYIIFRSGGAITTMAVGYLVAGKRYKRGQVVSVLILTVGIGLASMTNSNTKSKSDDSDEKSGLKGSRQVGMAMLFGSALLSSFQGLYAENTYRQYGGSNWKESLFYTHFLSLILFIPMGREIYGQFRMVLASEPMTIASVKVPRHILYLGLNSVTQYICVRGVNMLAGNTSALAVTIALNIRKFMSLILSTILFGNSLSPQGMLGAGLVFTGALLYSASK
uniref:ARAD1D28072p n=1 Tax=Blastobotrys adeninivorans TaxID=409370 RepID=A0A060TG58_BLAAD